MPISWVVRGDKGREGLRVMVRELARHRRSRVTEKVRAPVGGVGVGQGKEGSKRCSRRRRQGKHVEWSRAGAAFQGLVWRGISASLLLLSCHRNLILKSVSRLCVTDVLYGQMLLELDRHQWKSSSAAGI